MKSILFFSPPGFSFAAPSPAVPTLLGYLRAKDIQADEIDLNSKLVGSLVGNLNQQPIVPEQLPLLNHLAKNYSNQVDLATIYNKNGAELSLEEMLEIPQSEIGDFIQQEIMNYYDDIKAYDVIGISVTVTRQLYAALVIAKMVKMLFPQKPVVLGGSAILSLFERIIYTPQLFDYFDFIVREDGTTPLLEFLNHKPVEQVHSIVYQQNRKVYLNNLSKLPEDFFSYAPIYQPAFLQNYPKPLVLGVSVHVGCYYGKCAFCDYTTKQSYGYQFCGEDRLVERLEKLQLTLGVDAFHLIGTGIKPIHLKYFASLINEHGLNVKWSAESLAVQFDPETIAKIKQSGYINLDFGLESASQPIRDFFNKGVKIDGFRKTLEAARMQDFRGITCNIILTTPISKKSDLQETFDFLKKYEYVIFHIFQNDLELRVGANYYKTLHYFYDGVVRARADMLVKNFYYEKIANF
jgi:hypothetical protein